MSRIFKINLITLLIALVLSACGKSVSTPAAFLPTLTSSQTAAPTSTQTPVPTSLATATLTPFPTLGSGPYWLTRQKPESQAFSIYNSAGERKTIELPADGHIKVLSSKLDDALSPDKQWLVFYTGTANYLAGETELPLTLKLLNIKSGAIKTVAIVVTDGYVQKLDQLATKLKELHPENYQPKDSPQGKVDWVSDSLIETLETGIYSFAWSPDGRSLTFAAQIDSLSSDVYLYELETGNIQQTEDTLQNVKEIRWSIDGKKIVFENSEPGYGYSGTPELYVIKAGEKVTTPEITAYQAWMGNYDTLTQTWSPGGDWLSSNLLLLTGQTPDAGSSGITALNIETQQTTDLWEQIFGGHAVDPEHNIILISPSDFTDPESMGVYFVTLNGEKTKIFEGLYYVDLYFRGGEKHRFILQGISNAEIRGPESEIKYPISGQVIGLDLNGKPTSLGEFEQKQKISISPDDGWLLLYDDETLRLYDKNDSLVKTFPIAGLQRIFWQPDSQAILYSAGSKLYTLSLPGGETKWIGDGAIYDAVWLP